LNPKNKTALVTGAGKRIGRNIALSLAKAGSKVAVHYNTSKKEALNTVKIINENDGSAFPFKANLENVDEINVLVSSIEQKFGCIEILINNASMFNRNSLKNINLSDWDKMMAINFTAPFLLAQLMKKNITDNNFGKIINIGDWRTARKKRFSYGVSKSALSGLTKSLAVALAPNIQVNEIALGAILPPADTGITSEKDVKKMDLGPANRLGTVNEISSAILSLINNDFITGEKIRVDGGRHIY
jgi:pteridine reductase